MLSAEFYYYYVSCSMCVTKAQFNYTLKLAGTWVKLELGDTIRMVELQRERE